MRTDDIQKFRSILTEGVLTEASTLNDLGVSQKDISKIHKRLRLQHDAQWTPIKNKKELKDAIYNKHVGIAVNKDGRAFGIGHSYYPMKGAKQEVYIYDPVSDESWPVANTTAAIAKIPRGFKYYISTETDVSASRYDRRPDYSYGDNFLEKAKPLEKVIKSDAMKGYNEVREYMIDHLEDDDFDLSSAKKQLTKLKNVAEKGFDGFDIHGSHGAGALLKDFFDTQWDFNLDSDAERFSEKENLPVEKFVKYARDIIREYVNMGKGEWYQGKGQRANDYLASKEKMWDTLNK